MALPTLAGLSDLQARGVDADSTPARQVLAETMLAVASATVRGAAQSPILEKTSTIELTCWGGDWLDLPGLPIRSVSVVELDGTTLTTTDYRLDRDKGALWRFCGWGNAFEPTPVVVTMLHGLNEVPEDIINLVCDLTILGMNVATEGAIDSRTLAERIDDYSVTFKQGAEAVASALELPRASKVALRSRFGGGVGMVSHR